jgi:hypothetical protein
MRETRTTEGQPHTREGRLWHMNADFEMELAALPGPYRRRPTIARQNRRLARYLLRLARPGDGLLVDEPWSDALRDDARRADVELVAPGGPSGDRDFTPWGWAPSAIAAGRSTAARMDPLPLEVVLRVNSKLYSHALERELGVAVPGARTASTAAELADAVAAGCPGAQDKWVVKSPLGFAARERVLGRGPRLDPASAVWTDRQFREGRSLLFEPWHTTTREYGVPLWVRSDGVVSICGIVDVVTNGAGAALGYMLGRAVEPGRRAELGRLAAAVGNRLYREGYTGPAGVDALEHEQGFRPLLEINARYTMGFVALEVERTLAPDGPTFWSTSGNDEG